MTRYTLLILLVIFPFLGKAQENTSHLIPAKIKQNSIMLGGDATASYSRFRNSIDTRSITGSETGNSFQAISRFRAGYFFLNDFVVGINFNANYIKASTTLTTNTAPANSEVPVEETKTEVSRTMDLLAGPYMRYYLNNGVFGEVTGSAGLLNFIPGKKYNLYEATAGVGYAYFINEKVAIEPKLSFQYLLKSNAIKNDYSFGPMLGIGIQAYFYREQARVIRYGL